MNAARRPVVGADHVARFLIGALSTRADVQVTEEDTRDGLGFVLWREGRIHGVVTVEVRSALIAAVRIVLNPAKLSSWN